MKKNLLTVITFALVIVNLALTAVLAVAIVPEVKKVDSLVSKISDAIDLDLEAGTASDADSGTISMDQIAPYSVTGADGTSGMTINLKKGEDGQDHYAVISVVLSLNKKSDAYATYNTETLATYDNNLRSTITKIISSYTIDELENDQQAVLNEIKDELNKQFGSDDLIADVGFSSITLQ